MKKYNIFFLITSLTVVAIIAIQFSLIGSPATQRKANFDRTRVLNFQSIKSSMDNYYTEHKSLPKTLGELTGTDIMDPEMGNTYEYQILSKDQFSLCATFLMDYTEEEKYKPSEPYNSEEKVAHPAGYYCKTYTAVDYNTETTFDISVPIKPF